MFSPPNRKYLRIPLVVLLPFVLPKLPSLLKREMVLEPLKDVVFHNSSVFDPPRADGFLETRGHKQPRALPTTGRLSLSFRISDKMDDDKRSMKEKKIKTSLDNRPPWNNGKCFTRLSCLPDGGRHRTRFGCVERLILSVMPILDTHIDGYDDVDENGRFKKRYTPTVKSKTDQVPAALIDSLTSSRTRITSAEHVLNNVGFKMFSAEVIQGAGGCSPHRETGEISPISG